MIKKSSNILDGYVTPKGLKFEFEKDEKILLDSFLFLPIGYWWDN